MKSLDNEVDDIMSGLDSIRHLVKGLTDIRLSNTTNLVNDPDI